MLNEIQIARYVSASAFLIEFVMFAYMASTWRTPKYQALQNILLDNLLVAGLNMMLNLHQATATDPRYSYLVYSVSCVALIVSMYRTYTLDQTKAPVTDLPKSYYLMCLYTFLTIVAGFVIYELPLLPQRVAVYIGAFVPFVFALVSLRQAVSDTNGKGVSVVYPWMHYVTIFALAWWNAYPVAILLGPNFLNTISFVQESLGYLIADIVTKHLYMIVTVIYFVMYPRIDPPLDVDDIRLATDSLLKDNRDSPFSAMSVPSPDGISRLNLAHRDHSNIRV
jgi:hypothetical protein